MQVYSLALWQTRLKACCVTQNVGGGVKAVFVMTVDQRSSRRGPDRVEALLPELAGLATPARPFERTAGDEVQAVFEDPADVVRVGLELVRRRHWSVGIGAGPVTVPLPDSTRAGTGPAFFHARAAVTRAKHTVDRIAVEGSGTVAGQADAVLALLAAVLLRRSAQGWEAVDLTRAGMTQADIAARLGITRQAVSERLRSALFGHEERVAPVAARLLAEAAAG